MNKVILVGGLGRDCEVREHGENKVINFSVATKESYKNKQGEWVDKTDWHNIVFWRPNNSKINNYLLKGATVAIEGKLQTRVWESDAGKKYITEVIASKVDLVGKRQDSQPQTPVLESGGTAPGDDLPF